MIDEGYEDIIDLIESIMNLVETEIEALKTLNITYENLEQELKNKICEKLFSFF